MKSKIFLYSLVYLTLIFSPTLLCAEQVIRIHCVGDGFRMFKDIGSEDISVEKFYEFYEDRMTETVNSGISEHTKQQITQKTNSNYGIYSIKPKEIYVQHDEKILGNNGNVISSQWKQISINRQTSKWDFMLISNLPGLAPNTISIHGLCEPWKPENKF